MTRQFTTARPAFLFASAAALALAFLGSLASAPGAGTAPASADPLASEPGWLVGIATSCVDAGADAELFIAAPGDDVSSDGTGPAARPMRGYCRCTCSAIPNCVTNADCGGGLCLKGPTCC